jgi:hypothetical protein
MREVIAISDVGYQISGSSGRGWTLRSGEKKDLTQRSEADEEQRAQRRMGLSQNLVHGGEHSRKKLTTEVPEWPQRSRRVSWWAWGSSFGLGGWGWGLPGEELSGDGEVAEAEGGGVEDGVGYCGGYWGDAGFASAT